MAARRPWPFHCHIFLDGKEIEDVAEVNSAEGWIIRIVRDPLTNRFLRHGDNVVRERLTGKVEVVLKA